MSPVLHELPTNERVALQARDLVARLNDMASQDAIARHIELTGVRGKALKNCDCVMSRYIEKKIPDVKCAWVSPTWIALYSDQRDRDAEWRVPISLGQAPLVRSFIRRFDDLQYLYLLDGTP